MGKAARGSEPLKEGREINGKRNSQLCPPHCSNYKLAGLTPQRQDFTSRTEDFQASRCQRCAAKLKTASVVGSVMRSSSRHLSLFLQLYETSLTPPAQGIARLSERLAALVPTLVVLEATGGLELPLVAELLSAQLPVVVVNPRQVRDFAKALGKLAKTDTLDARVLAQSGEATKPQLRPLADAQTQELQALVARRRQLVGMLTAEKNRMRTATPRVQPQLQEHIRWLEQHLEGSDKELRGLVPVAWE